jgi:glucuronoarabinoxylan endo-1,4-beta-xylanase
MKYRPNLPLRRGILFCATVVAGACGASQDPTNVSVAVDAALPHQTLVGFGAATAYQPSLLSRRNDDIYKVLFVDSGLDILRLGNWFQNQGKDTTPATGFSDQAGVQIVQKATAARGGVRPKLLMSSWTPPAYLKSNGVTKPGYGNTTTPPGTLIQKDGGYAYADFADWWVRSLQAYAAQGIMPDYISIQNEPDFFINQWETCLFGATEGGTVEGIAGAGYGQALDAVYDGIQAAGLASPPVLLGPETTGFGDDIVQKYMNGVNAAQLGGVAHHMYGTTEDNPSADWFDGAMRDVARTGASVGLPTFMTEYSPNAPTMFDTALLINNAMTVENASAYIYWELIWNDANPQTGLVSVPQGLGDMPYTINDIYYALVHFARWTDPGWVRVDTKVNASSVRASAYLSPEGTALTLVLLNADGKEHFVTVNAGAFPYGTLAVYRTSDGASGDSERVAPAALEADGSLAMPPRSIATVTFTR